MGDHSLLDRRLVFDLLAVSVLNMERITTARKACRGPATRR
jgi:hypothetical protein